MKAYKFRLFPNKEDEQKLLWVLDICRQVYNRLLEEYYEKQGDRWALQAEIPKWKGEWLDLKKVYSKTIQFEVHRLLANLNSQKELMKRGHKVGRLRFKGYKRFKTFTYNQSGFKLLPKNEKFGFLHLSKIGDIPMRIHRPPVGDIKQVTIKHMASGDWYAFIIVDGESNKFEPIDIEKAIGLDVGLTSYIVDSDGNEVENPRYLKQALKKLRREQRRLSKKQKDSYNREKQRIIVARQYECVCNQRNDFQHKLSRELVNNYDLIVTEKLSNSDMIENGHLSRAISDASWSSFNQKLAYKAERAGKLFVQVDPRGTSQECSKCGKIFPKALSDRWHDCPYCGLHLSRDHNASINILKRGIEKVGQELPERACGHWTATPLRLEVQARWMKQETPVEG